MSIFILSLNTIQSSLVSSQPRDHMGKRSSIKSGNPVTYQHEGGGFPDILELMIPRSRDQIVQNNMEETG